jgi:hypothetical protein
MTRIPALPPRLCFLVVLVLSAARLPASESTPPSPGYHDVTVQTDGKPTVIRVKDSIGPRLHGESPADGHYNPENMDLGRTSSFANKKFSTSESALSKNDTASEARTDNRFITKSYSDVKPDSTSDFSRKYQTTAFANSARASGDLQKTFATSTSDMAQTKETAFAKTSGYQGQTAVLGGPKNPPFSGLSPLGDKTFSDPEMMHVRRDPYAANLDVSRMVDLPNRPLTIDEVRNLINHETIPNLDAKPEPPTKPLNDPGYEPPVQAPFAHEPSNPGPEEKDDGLPSPGTMAAPPAPENSEPLPK